MRLLRKERKRKGGVSLLPEKERRIHVGEAEERGLTLNPYSKKKRNGRLTGEKKRKTSLYAFRVTALAVKKKRPPGPGREGEKALPLVPREEGQGHKSTPIARGGRLPFLAVAGKICKADRQIHMRGGGKQGQRVRKERGSEDPCGGERRASILLFRRFREKEGGGEESKTGSKKKRKNLSQKKYRAAFNKEGQKGVYRKRKCLESLTSRRDFIPP